MHRENFNKLAIPIVEMVCFVCEEEQHDLKILKNVSSMQVTVAAAEIIYIFLTFIRVYSLSMYLITIPFYVCMEFSI